MNLWERLLAILQQQLAVYEKIKPLLLEQQKALRDNEIETVQTVVAEQGALLKHVHDLEKKRLQALAELARDLACQEEELTLEQIAKLLPEKYQEFYQQIKLSLSENLQEVKQINQTNEELVQMSLTYLNYSLSLMAGMQTSNAYGQQGQEQENKNVKRSIFDQKI